MRTLALIGAGANVAMVVLQILVGSYAGAVMNGAVAIVCLWASEVLR